MLAAIVLIIILVNRGGDSSSGPNLSIVATTVPTVSAPNVTDSVAPVVTDAPSPPPPNAGPKVGPDVVAEVDDILGGKNVILPENCVPVTPGMQQVDQVGGSPLVDRSLEMEAVCFQAVSLDGSQVPMFVGDFLFAAVVNAAPVDPVTNIGYQPGIGFDFPLAPDYEPRDEGEGLTQVPVDVVGYGENGQGWLEAQFLSLPDYSPSDVYGYSFTETGSRVTAFVVPTEFVPPDTLIYLQNFGRLTAPGATPTGSDPAASSLWLAGPTPCLGGCVVPDGRFQVTASWPTDPTTVVDAEVSPGGQFWFFSPDNVELVVKVLDACDTPGFNSFWVFAGSLTNVEVSLTVTDTSSGDARTYNNSLGRAFEPIMDTSAFATCP